MALQRISGAGTDASTVRYGLFRCLPSVAPTRLNAWVLCGVTDGYGWLRASLAPIHIPARLPVRVGCKPSVTIRPSVTSLPLILRFKIKSQIGETAGGEVESNCGGNCRGNCRGTCAVSLPAERSGSLSCPSDSSADSGPASYPYSLSGCISCIPDSSYSQSICLCSNVCAQARAPGLATSDRTIGRAAPEGPWGGQKSGRLRPVRPLPLSLAEFFLAPGFFERDRSFGCWIGALWASQGACSLRGAKSWCGYCAARLGSAGGAGQRETSRVQVFRDRRSGA